MTDLGDELVLLDPRTQHMFALDEVGRFTWFELSEAELGVVVGRIVERYSVDQSVVEADLAQLVTELLEADLVERYSDEAPTP